MSELRLRKAVRNQIEYSLGCIDELLPDDHRARLVWQYVEAIDLSPLLKDARCAVGYKGAPLTDPHILLALWLFATLDSVGSAREVARLCERDHAYRWICGGISVNHHTLSTFRTNAGAFLDDLLTKSVTALIAAGVVNLSCIAVDSMRVRADAGSSSFRSKERLLELQSQARAHVLKLKTELETTTMSTRHKARRERAAQERLEAIDAALQAAADIEAAHAAEDKATGRKTPKKRSQVRASTTDPEARRIKMANGGTAPAYSLQIKTDPQSAAVIGVDVISCSSDRGKLAPAIAEIRKRYGVKPDKILADSGYDGHADIEKVESEKIAVYVPLPKKEASERSKKKETSGVRAWKERMATEEAKKIYARRMITELPHAQMRNHGLSQMPVRGTDKVKAIALLFAIASNLLLHTAAMIATA